MADYILAIDQGTTSTRAIIFDKKGSIVSTGQLEHEQIFPKAGWVEHDPMEIWRNAREVIGQALGKADLTRHDIAAVGITNQRETAVVWDKNTGEPVYNAIVWQDTAPSRSSTGSRPTAASSGSSRTWACRSRPTSRARRSSGSSRTSTARASGRGRRPALRHDRLLGPLEPDRRRRRRRARDGCHEREPHDVHGPGDARVARRHPRGVRRAALDDAGDPGLVGGLRHRRGVEPAARGAGRRHPRRPAGGDVRPGRVRSGRVEEHVRHGQLPDLQHGRGDRPLEERTAHDARLQARRRQAHYALEGAIAVTGSLVQWLRDNLGLISNASEVEDLAKIRRRQRRRVLRAGVLRPVRAVLASGRPRRARRPHQVREQGPHRPGRLEATAFQTREVLDAVNADSGRRPHRAQGRRRHDRQQHADAVPGRHPRRAGRAPGGRGDDGARRGLCRPASRSASGRTSTSSARTGRRTRAGSRRWIRPSATVRCDCGRRPSRRPSTGSTTTCRTR